jgi:hypothetical protein
MKLRRRPVLQVRRQGKSSLLGVLANALFHEACPRQTVKTADSPVNPLLGGRPDCKYYNPSGTSPHQSSHENDHLFFFNRHSEHHRGEAASHMTTHLKADHHLELCIQQKPQPLHGM